MFNTQVLSLEELTEIMFKERHIIFTPSKRNFEKDKSDTRYEPVFMTEKSWETPLGIMQVEFATEGINLLDPGYRLWFFSRLKKLDKEPHLHIDISFYRGPISMRKIGYIPKVKVRKGHLPERLPPYLNSTTLTPDNTWKVVNSGDFHGYRLSRIDRWRAINNCGVFVTGFIGGVISLADLNIPKDYDEKEKLERRWCYGFLKLAQAYADYVTHWGRIEDE